MTDDVLDALPLSYTGIALCGKFSAAPLRIYWCRALPFFPSVSQWHSWDSNPQHVHCSWTHRPPTEPCARSLRTAWNIMQRNAYIKMSIPGWPPHPDTSHYTFSFLQSMNADNSLLCHNRCKNIDHLFLPSSTDSDLPELMKNLGKMSRPFSAQLMLLLISFFIHFYHIFFIFSQRLHIHSHSSTHHDIISTHASSFFHLFSFFKHLRREKFKLK